MMSDEHIVHPPAEHAADEGATIGTHHQSWPARNTSLPHPADAVNSRGAEVARRVDRVAGVEAERRADQHDQQPHDHRREAGRRRRVAESVIPRMTPTSSAVPTI